MTANLHLVPDTRPDAPSPYQRPPRYVVLTERGVECAEWLKQHPGKSIDDWLALHGEPPTEAP